MRFPYPIINAFEDVTHNLEALAFAFNPNALKEGTATITWAGGSATASVAVTHALGVAPTQVLLTGSRTSDPFAVVLNVDTIGAQTFVVRAFSPQGNPAAGTSTVYWQAGVI